MEKSRLAELFLLYTSNTISKTEKEELFKLLAKAENDDQVRSLMDQLWESIPDANPDVVLHERHLNKILEKTVPVASINRSVQFTKWYKIAAVFLLTILATGT